MVLLFGKSIVILSKLKLQLQFRVIATKYERNVDTILSLQSAVFRFFKSKISVQN